MAEGTKIEWVDHTFNPWLGCTKVSPACDHCYAEQVAKRQRAGWGAGVPRKLTTAAWHEPPRWDRRARRAGRRERVFCASLADVADREVPRGWQHALWRLIGYTPHLDWLLLTKRHKALLEDMRDPEIRAAWVAGARQRQGELGLPAGWQPRDGEAGTLPNVWAGVSVETQRLADARLPYLAAMPAVVRFISAEPLLEELDLRAWLAAGLDWVITGGESGPKARPSDAAWFRSLREQCAAAGVPFFFKQWGEHFAGTRVGKRQAGRALDGRTHDAVPAPVTAVA